MKKIIAAILAASALFSMAATAFAEGVSIRLNGEELTFDTDIYIKNDRTMVPLRGVFEACGASVTWDRDTKTVGVVKRGADSDKYIFLQAGADYAFVNSEKKELDAPAEITNDRTMVPLRFIMEELDAEVLWDAEGMVVSIVIPEE